MELITLTMRDSKIRSKLLEMSWADLLRSPDEVNLMDDRLIEIQTEFFDLLFIREHAAKKHGIKTPAPPFVAELSRKKADEIAADPPGYVRPGTAVAALFKLVDAADTGISTNDLKILYRKLDSQNKAEFYSVFERLKRKALCLKYKAKCFTPNNLAKFKEDVAAGRRQDLADEEKKIVGKWANDVLAYLRERADWVTVGEITNYIIDQPSYIGAENAAVQVCAALKKLKTRYELVEKTGGTSRAARWRAKPSDQNAAAIDETVRATEPTPSVARH
jgi:hypothetical protein